MKHRFRSNEDKWTMIMEMADRMRDELKRKQELEIEAMLDELADIGALATSIDKNTGETLYRYDDTDPRARMIMQAMANTDVNSVQ